VTKAIMYKTLKFKIKCVDCHRLIFFIRSN